MQTCATDPTVDQLIDQAAAYVGGRGNLARLLKVKLAAIGNWKTRGIPIVQCVKIDQLTNGKVGRRGLRPDDWQDIWPELVQAQQGCAPAAPEFDSASAAYSIDRRDPARINPHPDLDRRAAAVQVPAAKESA